MLRGVEDPIVGSANAIDELLSRSNQRSTQKTRHQTNKVPKLPKRLQRDIKKIQAAKKVSDFVPYRTPAEIAKAKGTVRKLEKHLDRDATKPDNVRRIGQWFARILVNYMVFLALLAVFWYVATKT